MTGDLSMETVPIVNPPAAAAAAVALVPAAGDDLQVLATVYELCLNVSQWSQAEGSVFVEQSEDHAIITIQDDGVGIPETMRARYPDLSNARAVAGAIEPGVTASGKAWRGYGLSSLVYLSERDGFSVCLTSRDIAVWMTDGRVTFGGKSGGSIRGTMVQIVLSPAGDRSG